MNTSACHDCHTPKVMTPNGPELDTSRLLTGHPSSAPMPKVNKDALKDWVLFGQDLTSAAGPWGVSFAANLTSDETGIGKNNSLRQSGKGSTKDWKVVGICCRLCLGRCLAQMTDTDLKAIYEYLQTTEPVSNIVPAPITPDDIQ